MDLPILIESLSDPGAYPHPVERVGIRQTHISVVFLAGPFVYKIKKPVNPGFLDFTTLEKRLHFCREEVRLNRRLAPDVYLGVVPIAREGDRLRVEGVGEVVEWAVKMRRLPDDASLLQRLERRELGAQLLVTLGQRLADFHRRAEGGERVAAFGRFDAVARVVWDTLERARPQLGATVHRDVFARLTALVEDSLSRLRPLIAARADRSVPRDGHGDLHLDHVYHFPDRPPPADLIAIDCVEFSDRLRCTDPVADAAFLAMDLAFHGRRDLALVLADSYFAASGDSEGRALLPLYTAYRAAVRGMVEGLLLAEPEVPGPERETARASSRGHWLLALAELEPPGRRPGLVLVGGLPGTGKSTLAGGLAAAAGFRVVRSDVVRKELAELPTDEPTPASTWGRVYSAEWTARTYAECLRRAEATLFEGGRVVVDATFRDEGRRREFLDAAVRYGVPHGLIVCEAGPDTTAARLRARAGDASDADWSVHEELAAAWEVPGPETERVSVTVRTEGPVAGCVTLAAAALATFGLWEAGLRLGGRP